MSCTVCGNQATVYCKNDEARLCVECDVQIHQANPLAACHKRVPYIACSLCNNSQAVVYCHNDQANLCAACDSSVHASLPFKHHIVPLEQDAATSAPIEASNPSQQAPAIPPAVELPLNTIMDKDSLAKSLWGQDMQGFDMDSSWLDRLDMGFDFSDILDEPSDGLVPTLSPTAAEAAAAAFMAPASLPNELALPACSPPLMEVGLMAVPQAPVPKADSRMQHEDLLAPMMVPQMLPPPPPAAAPKPALSAVPRPPPPAPQPTSSSVLSLASSSTRANTRAAAAAACSSDASLPRALSIPNSEHLTREQRVARYLEKRKNRKFQKTIRYASRKAYAEVRPRIKGRFAKREEVQAWRVAEAAMAANAPAGFHMAAGNDMTVPVM